MAQYDTPTLQENASALYVMTNIAAVAGGVWGFNPTTRLPEVVTSFTYDSSGHVVFADAKNVILNSTTGTKIGTAATQKLGFWGVAPIVQPSSANQAALVDSTTGSADGTVVDVGAVFSQSAINNNFADVIRLVNQLRADLVASGGIKGSA